MNPQRMPLSARLFVALTMTVVMSACGGGETSGSTAPDPAGTVTSAIRIQGQGAFLIDFDTGAVTSTNNAGQPDMYVDTNVNFNVGVNFPPSTPRRIADVGAVGGLGDVSTLPTAGWVATSGTTVGHGYVLEDNAKHWRIYVSSLITAAGGGGVIGVNIKWAPL